MKAVIGLLMCIAASTALVFGVSSALADDLGSGSGSAVASPIPPAAQPAPASAVPDPHDQPQESASLLYRLYKAGHLVPAIVVLAFFLLQLLQRWVAWFRTGYRKLAVAAVLAGLGMLAERAAAGTTPNLSMTLGALGVAFAMWMKTEGEPKPEPKPEQGTA